VSEIYTVLARKWRPLRFADVVGQDVAVQTLRHAIERDRVAHAYLFAGSRGTGKTTVARILARALNCEKGPTPDPCGECGPCREILQGTSLDVLEIDGASTRGIDDVRRLREDVKLSPTGGRNKVYIIDEVHMLTGPAFNALLKTLEEPPAHVVFVLATTDPQKLPETILSRCQRFNFTRIGVRDAVDRLKQVLEGEGVEMTDGALMVLARRSGGALRDALGFLDQVMASDRRPIDEEAAVEALGLVGSDLYVDLVRAFIDRDPGTALSLVGQVHRSGHDLEFFVQGLLECQRNLLVLKSAPGADELLEVSSEERDRLKELAEPLAVGDLLQLTRITVEIADQIRRSDYPWVHLEVGVVEMAGLDRVADLAQILEELRHGLGNRVDSGSGVETSPPPRPSGGGGSGSGARAPARPPKGSGPESGASGSGKGRVSASVATDTPMTAVQTPDPVSELSAVPSGGTAAFPVEAWASVLEHVKAEKPLLWSVLSQGDPGTVERGVLDFRIDPQNGFHVEQLREPAHLALIESCLRNVYDSPLKFEVRLQEGAGAHSETVKRRKVLEDPFIKKLLEFLDGEIVG